jgi:hypothetical protein
MKRLLAVTLILFSTQVCQAQVAAEHFTTSFPAFMQMTGVAPDHSGGMIYCGTTGPTTFRNLFVMRIDAAGQILWQYTYPCAFSMGPDVLHTDTTGIYIAGFAEDTSTGITTGFTVHLSTNGTLLWQNKYGCPNIIDLAPTPEGNYVAISNKDQFKFDSTGATLWSYRYHSSTVSHTFTGVMVDKNGDSYALGSAYSTSTVPSAIIVKSDAAGEMIWCRSYPFSNVPSGWYDGMITDSGLFVYGWSMYPASPGNYNTLNIARIDAAGTILQIQSANATATSSFYIYDAEPAGTNSIVFGGTRDVVPMIASFNATTFNFEWGVYRPGASNETVFDISVRNNGGVKYAGGVAAFAAPTDPFFFGQLADSVQFGCGWYPFTTTHYIQNTMGGNFVLDTVVILSHASFSATSVALSLSIDTCRSLTAVEPIRYSVETRVFPNPAQSTFVIQLSAPATEDLPVSVYNVMGELVLQKFIPGGATQAELSVEELCPGLYFVKAEGSAPVPLEVTGG